MKKILKSMIFLILLAVLVIVIYQCYKSFKSLGKKENPLEEKRDIIKIEDKDISKSIFKKNYKEAVALVSKMSIEEKIGQLFLVRYNKNDVEYLSNFSPGGYILFAKDFENHTKDSIRSEIDNNQRLNKYPLIIGVDEEGGFVTRVSRYNSFRSEKFSSPKFYYEQGGYELLEKMENEKALLLKEIGINLNLAPVADVSMNKDDFIYNRAFGYDAVKTSEFVTNMVKYANNNKINSCLKHFPGYGNNIDTHSGIAIDNRSYESIKENDFLPFIAGIKENVPSILVSHNIITSIDEKYPASLSSGVVSKLRDELNYTGIIMTDDLAMDAVKSYVEDGLAATLALNAGNDMIITSDFVSMYKEVLDSYKKGKIKEKTINKAVLRIIAWKYYSDLFKNKE